MSNNLRLYDTFLKHLCQWLPDERITRVRNFCLLVCGMYLSRSVHLSRIVSEWPIFYREASLVNRLHRFLCNRCLHVQRYYHPVASFLLERFRGEALCLIIDASPVGFSFQLLTISVAYRRRCLPICWRVYPGKRGRLPARAAMVLCRYVKGLMPEDTKVTLVADNGFESCDLLRFLTRLGWSYVIRQRGCVLIRYPNTLDWIPINTLAIGPGQSKYIGMVYLTKQDYGPVYLSVHWKKGEDDPWYLISDIAGKQPVLRYYKKRMWTEQLYGDLKGHGVDLQNTHLRDPKRIERLVLGACYIFVWLITLGSQVIKQGHRALVDRKERRDKSLFRIGWDWVKRCFKTGNPIKINLIPC